MKREIKFRGKSNVDGEWYFGSYVKTNDDTNNPFKTTASKEYHNIVYYAAPDFLLGGWNKEPVIPETVGQFTGLFDKNGKEIWEHDIVDWDGAKLLVEFVDGGFCMHENYEDATLHDLFFERDKINVIGNIHDNPELLKAETL